MSIIYHFPLYTRRQPRTKWKGGMITETDLLPLDRAASLASKHAETEVSAHDFLLAAARGEILLRAIVHRGAKLRKYDGGIYCNEGTPTENMVPEGAIPTLPVSACLHLANISRASWRTIDGYEEINGVMMRFEIASLLDEEPDFETTLSDCCVSGYDVHALADAYIDPDVCTKNRKPI